MSEPDRPNVESAVRVLENAKLDWEYLSDNEKYAMMHDALDQLVETGERVMESPMTGQKYRVTRWIEKGNGKIVALNKEPVDSE